MWFISQSVQTEGDACCFDFCLQPAQPYVQPALDFLSERPYLLYGAVGLPALGVLFTLLSALFGSKKVRCCLVCFWGCLVLPSLV